MNFPGKFGSPISGELPTAFVDVDTFKHHNPEDKSGSITIVDAQLLFNGDYTRSGVDLILSKDGHQHVVANYFKGEHRASLASPDGAHLTGEIVSSLAGNVEYAQATNPADVGKVIGHVTKIVGNATAIRNGVSIILNNGDNVEKGDVVQAGSDSQLGITFVDGTVFGLSSNARMVLNEMVYDPNGSSNSSLLTLVAGTISFVAGETAKHGDMKVDTPTAVLGIRGTAVLVEIDFTVPNSGTTPAVNFQVLAEPDGHTGSYILYSKPTAANPISVEIGRVDQSGQSYTITANNQLASTAAPAMSPQAAAIVLETFIAKFNAPPPQVTAPTSPDKTAPNANPNSTSPGGGGSSTPPPPATPLDTSPIDNHNTQPTDQIPTPTPISTTPTPSGTGTTLPTTTPTTIAAAGGAIVTITVTPAADTPSFTIPQHVTTPSAPPATFVAFVPGSGTVPSVTTNGAPPPGVDLTKLITVNESTGAVGYNPADFAFLKQGQSAIATIAFQSNDGTENVPETLTLTIDGQAPVPPVVAVSNPSIIITNSATQTISGTVAAGLAAAGATVTLLDTVNGVTQQIGTATVASDGTWATQVTLQGDGTHSIVAQDTDAVGNVGSSTPVVVTLDTIPPTVTITTAGNVSNVATHTISGTVLAGDAAIGTTVELLDTALDPATQLNVTKLIGTATVGPGGTWTTSVTLSGDGDHTIVATDIDAAGGVGSSSPVVFTLSTTLPPTVTIATAPETSNSATQTISGHVSQGQSPIGTTIALYDTFNGVTSEIGSATIDGNGGWTTQVTLSGDGVHNIVAQDIDIAGNLGASDPVVFTLDTLPPTVVINTAGITTNHSLQAISGSVTAGEAAVGSAVALLDNGNVIGTATVGSGGLWATNVTLSGDGIHNIVAQDSDAAGNVGNSTPIAFTLDTAGPTVKISTTGTTTNQAQQTISGSVTTAEATAGSTVTLFDNGNAIGTASVGSGGAWTTGVTLSGDGVHNITAQDIDAVGNLGTSTPVVLTLDTLAPTVTIGTPGTTTNQATQTISGTVTTIEAAAGNTVTLLDTVNGVTTQIGTATLSGGNWSTSVTLSGNGANSIVAQDTDAAGNTGSSSVTVFTLATVAPTIAITGPVAGDNIVNKAEAAAGVAIGGTAAAGIGGAAVNGQTATITIVNATNTVKDTLTTTVSGGAWSVNLTAAQAQGLADGSYTIKANVSDTAGNVATTATRAITVDETSPTIAITSPVAGDNIINKTEAAAGVTISGTVAAGPASTVNGQTATITIVDSTDTVKDILTTTVSGGAWTVNLSAAQAQGLADGSYTVKANVSDAAGNAATTATQAITVDETGPTIAITSPVAGDNIVNKAEAAAGVTISGTAASTVNGQTATITIVDATNAVKDTLTTTVSGGAWSVSLSAAQAQGLADGSYTIKANVTDTAGNAAATATQAITIDETSPTIAITSPVAGDNIVNKTEAAAGVTISGTVAAGPASTVNGQTATITIVDSTNTVKDTLTTTVSGGAWTVNLSAAQAQGLADGSYTIKANVTDTAGNAATTATQALSIDTLAPTVTIGTPGTTTNQATQTISGTVTTTEAAAGNTVTLLDTVNGVTTQIGTATLSGGNWSTSVTLSGNGANSIVAQDTDAAGNTGSSSATVFTLATVAPTIAITSPVAGDNIINKAEAAAGVAIGGTAAAGIGGAAVNGQTATITIVDATNAVKDTLTTTVTGGVWSVNLTAAQAQGLADGSYTIKANVTDGAGNAATAATQAITVDETAPTIAITSPVAGDNIINKAEAAAGVTISGTAASTVNGQTATITIVDSTNTVKDTLTTTVSGGAWSVNLTAAQAQGLADGSYTIKANVSDTAGNVATTATQAITVDETSPTIAITSPVAGDNIINKVEAAAGVTISGTAASTVNGQTATITIVDATNTVKDTLTTTVSGGAWSVNLTAAQAQGLADGSYTIKANVSDTAGNVATTATQAITVDETSPTIAITSPVAGDNIINKVEAAAGVTISGTAASTVNGQIATITIVDATNTVKDTLTATVSGGAWSVNLTAAQAQGLADGSYTIKANVSDTAGNAATTATQAITVDETSPTIAITSPVAGDNIVNKAEATAGVTISGTAASTVNGQIATITIVDATNTVKDTLTATVSGGAWSVNLTAAQAQGLADGSYTIKANVSDTAGNAATTATQAITVDETSPTIAITSPVAGDNIVNKAEATAGVTISGTAASTVNGQIATIAIVDSTNTVKDTLTTTVSGGAWSVNLTAAQAQGLADGSYTIKANVSDTAGNAATTATQAITVDETSPTIAITSPVAGDNIVNKAEATAGVTISGTAASTVNGQIATITIVDSTNTVKDTLTATVSGGVWSVNLTAAQAQGLADGSYTIKANVSDTAGNAATAATQAITVDETSPTIVITGPVAGDNIINKAEAAAVITISGTVAAGPDSTVNGQTATITIVDGTNTVKDTLTTTVSGGAWTVNLSAAQAQGLADGSYTVKANVSDAAGNAATTATQALSIDTLAPTVTIGTPGTTTNQATQTISGTVTTTEAAAGNTVTLLDTVNGVTTQIGTATVSGGSWTTSVTLSGNGANSIVAQDTDAAGNTGSSTATVFTLATVAPTIAITGPAAGDNIINKAEAAAGVAIGGTAAPGIGGAAVNGQTATITIVDATNTVKDTLTTTVSGGAWSVNLTAAQAQGLADGSYTIKANVSDAAGNAATTATQAITVDETSPTIAITSPVAGDNIINKAEAAAGVTIGGTAAAGIGGAAVNGQTATITIVDATNTVKDTLTATVSGGAWSVNLTAAQAQGLADGSYTIMANVSDSAGNAATAATQVITVDETNPTIAITSPVAGDNIINKTEAATGVTISGTAAAGAGGALVNGQTATITIVDATNAVKDTLTTTVSGGAWLVSLSAAQAQGVADGSYTIRANVSDSAGNAATTATQAITIDETSPTIAITSPVAGDNIINKTEAAAGVTISGAAAAGAGGALVNGQTATITIVDGTSTVKDTLTTTVSGGAWSVNLSAAQAQGLADGRYTIKANVTDAAGNPATTATQAITVDTAPPTVTISSPGGPTSQSTETISGTLTTTEASAGGTVMLFDTFNGVTTQVGTATLSGSAWSTTVTLSGSGTHSIVAEDTDAAGNTGSSTPVVYSLTVVANSWANPSGGNWTVGANWSSGAVPSNTANVTIQPILATAPYSISISSGTTVLANSLMLDDPLAMLIDQGTLSIVGSLTLLAGTIDLENGGTLSLGTAASAFELNFAGTGGNLVLGNAGTYIGTVTALSTATGTVSISGSGNLAALTGDALDLTASGGTQSNPSNLVVGLTGTVTGAATGIDVVQNAVGNIAVTTSGSVTGQTQRGILAEESATGVGSVIVAGSANVAGDGSAFSGIVAENLNTANANTVTVSQTGNVTGGYDGIKALTDGPGSVAVTTGPGVTITGMNDYGIEAFSNSAGSVSVTTTTNDTIVSGSVGINVYNQATAIPQTGGVTTSTITVTATGNIDSGFLLTGSSSRPAGILAGYKGGTTAGANSAVYGNVIVNNSANINSAGGDGIRAYNYGNGNVTIGDLAGTTIVAQGEFGIQGTSYGSGNITISEATGDIIDSGSSGLAGVNLATSIAATMGSTVSVTARGTINSGVHLTPSGSQPQGVSSGYFPGNAGNSNTSVNGTVTLDNFANVTAAAGWALDAYNYGNGSVTLTDEANTTVSGAQYGIGAYSNSSGSASSGSVTINVLNNATVSSGSRYGSAGIQASESNGGIISVTTSTGDIVNSGGAGIAVNNSAGTATSASQINITSVGTINAGYGTNPGGGQADGIVAGYNPNNSATVNGSVAGNVIVNNSATIEGPVVTNGIPAPAITGIQLYNYGSGSGGGNISLTLQNSSRIISQIDGVNADAQGGGNVTIINNGLITDTSGVGISANIGMNVANSVTGLVQVTNTNTGTITALGSSYAPAVQINNSSTQTAKVNNSGTITANLLGKDSSNQAIAVYNGTSTITNTGTISGNVSLNGGTFNNNAGGIWNLGGSDYFGNGSSAIVNAGIINILGVTFLNAGATFTFTNTNTVNVAANGDAWVNAPVSGGGGTFTIGDRAELEFASSVATGQTVTFTDGNGLLVLDHPATFSGSIAGLAIGDAIELQGVGISSATISGSTLSVLTGNSGTLTYQISGTLANAAFDVLSGNEIVLLQQSSIPITGSVGAQFFAPTTGQFYAVTNATISASGVTALNINSSNGSAGNYLLVAINQGSSVTTSGAFSAINLASTFDNIELINWGSISSPGGTGISASSTSGGSVDIIDNNIVSSAQSAINAHTNGAGALNVVVGNGTSITSSAGSGIFAVATASGNIDVSTIQGATLNSGTTGIFAENQGTTVGSASVPSNILVSTSGTINSGSNAGTGEPAGILAGFLGGTTAPANPPNAVVFGNVIVMNSANITATAGMGIEGINEGIGDITINDGSGTTITATAAGATVAGFTQYGIAAFNYGSGKITVTTDYGSTITSGGAGIDAVNQATSIAAAANSTLTVIASGAITSGANLNNSGSAPAGILAGYNPGNAGVLNANVAGNVLVEYDGTVQNGVGGLVAGAGDGISAFDYGIGNVEVDLGFGAAITALNPASAGSTAPYGISASNRGTGDVTVNMSGGDSVHSGSIGINANNQDTSISAAANSMIVVVAAGTITSGTINSNNGSQPSGISAGYLGAGTGANTSINGTVIVDNNATINASAGSAINAYNYGNGDVTVNDGGGTTITGAQYGISAYTESGGTGNLSINVNANATITATNPVAASTSTLDYGIQAFSNEAGNISVITSSGDTITANGTGINAVNEATAIAQSVNSSIVVTANGTINSGTEETGTGTPPGGIVAGYLGGNSILTTYPLTGLFGEVDVNNYATINAAAGDGIRAYNYGIGDVEVNDFAGSITLQGQVATGNSGLLNGYGGGITASNEGSGNIDVMTAAGTSIDSSLAGSGIAAINKAPAPMGSTFIVPDTSHVSVLAYGTIKSGTDLTGSGDVAAGILAGYNPNNADTADNNVHGIVHIDDYASITAGGDGIRGVNYGDGTSTIIAEAGAVITAVEYGIAAIGGDGGDISITTSAALTGGTAAIHTTTSSPAETVTIENLGHMTGVVLTENAAFDNGAGAEWDLAGASMFASGTNTLTNEGVIDSTGTASITATAGTLGVTNTGTVNVQSGTLDIGGSVTGTGQFTIGAGDQLEFGGSVASGQTVTFEGSTGTLKLDDPVDFHGQISGLTGSDGINLQGFDATTIVTPVIGATQTSLTVTDDNHAGPSNDVVITLLGNYNGSSFNFSNVQGGVLIVDPPAATPAMATISATGADQTLAGTGTPDNFVFNFANVGQATVTNFHADADVVEVKASLFANLQAILDATHDDLNGNAVVALDGHDSITLNGVAKAQLHPTDFHLV